ncbi:MAG: hypothetical protein JEZ11_07905 [Desulfobacterales bacterium]|nr:hypothetical protein [Desulfobacterales bacterium]
MGQKVGHTLDFKNIGNAGAFGRQQDPPAGRYKREKGKIGNGYHSTEQEKAKKQILIG